MLYFLPASLSSFPTPLRCTPFVQMEPLARNLVFCFYLQGNALFVPESKRRFSVNSYSVFLFPFRSVSLFSLLASLPRHLVLIFQKHHSPISSLSLQPSLSSAGLSVSLLVSSRLNITSILRQRNCMCVWLHSYHVFLLQVQTICITLTDCYRYNY